MVDLVYKTSVRLKTEQAILYLYLDDEFIPYRELLLQYNLVEALKGILKLLK